MKRQGSHAVLLAATLLLGAAMAYYYDGILLPLRRSAYHVTNASPGNWSDLYPRWLGAREVLLHRRSPYSPEVTREIQRGFYGHLLDPSNPRDPVDQEGFAYPLYVVFLLAPSIVFPFAPVRVAFAVVLVVLALATIFLWVRGLRLHLSINSSLLAIIAVMSSYPVVDGIQLQQFTVLVAALMAAAIAALAGNRLMLAGVLLACATIKPQLVLVLALGLVLWSLADWRGRKFFVAGFGLTLLLLLGSSELLLPGWLGLWRQASRSYLAYVRPSLLGSVLGPAAGVAAGIAAVLATIALFWRFRRHGPGSQHFNFLIVTALFVSTLVAPNAGSAKYNLVLLIPACLWLFTFGLELKTRSVLGRFSWWLAVNALLWQWLLAFVVVIGVVVFRHPLEREATPFAAGPEILLFFFPLLLAPFLLSAFIHLNRFCRTLKVAGWQRSETSKAARTEWLSAAGKRQTSGRLCGGPACVSQVASARDSNYFVDHLTDGEVFASLLSVSPVNRNGPGVWPRIFISVAIGIASGLLCRALMLHLGLGAADFNYALREGRDLLAGRDPYEVFHGATAYPLPAAVLALPFLRFSPETAGALFFGLSSACLAFALSREGSWRLLAFLAYPYWAAMLTVQWVPLVMAGALVPWLFAAAVAKPQVAAPLFFAYPNWRSALAAALLLLASLIIMPSWPLRWISGVSAHTHFVPLLALPGPALLLALYRRRDPDSHLLLLSALTPQHWFYDSFMLWLIPRNRQEMLATIFLSWGAGITRWYFMPRSWTEVGTWAVLWIYLPMLGVILMRQNAGKEMTAQLRTPHATKAATMHE